jgi:hypothetical protein
MSQLKNVTAWFSCCLRLSIVALSEAAGGAHSRDLLQRIKRQAESLGGPGRLLGGRPGCGGWSGSEEAGLLAGEARLRLLL